MVLAIALTVAGVLAGAVISFLFFKRGGSARSKLLIELKETSRIDPATVGAYFEMRVGGQRVKNLLLLELTVTNRGHRDLCPAAPGDRDGYELTPRVELPKGIRALVDPWTPDDIVTAKDVRVARKLEDEQQHFYIHVHRLEKRSEVRTRIVCHYVEGSSHPPLAPGSIGFFPGFLPDTTVVPCGLLAPPPSLLTT